MEAAACLLRPTRLSVLASSRLVQLYFNVYKSQIPATSRRSRPRALMLGTDKSRGYCIEMICADFLAGANLENGNSHSCLQSILSFFKFLPGEESKAFLDHFAEKMS